MISQVKPKTNLMQNVAEDPRLSSGVRAFLKLLNSGDGPPLEALPSLEARQVLVDAQASVVDADFETDSYHQFGDKRYLTVPTMKWMYDMYISDPEKRKDIHASPLQATIEQLKGLPPALVVVAESDILHDEGTAYGRKLDQAGVDVTLVQYDGMIHDFGLLNALAELPSVRSLFVQAAAELKKRLQ